MTTKGVPADLKGAGRKLWIRIEKDYSISGLEEAIYQMCKCSSRLEQIRMVLEKEGLVTGTGDKQKRHCLLDSEVKTLAQFRAMWKTCGLAGDDRPRNPVGRPSKRLVVEE